MCNNADKIKESAKCSDNITCQQSETGTVCLHKAQEEIKSQKLIISLLNEDNKPVNQLQQPNLEINNGLHTDEVLLCPPRPKKTHTSQDTLNYKQYEQYAIPTSNRYAALYSLPDHVSRNLSPAPHQDFRHINFHKGARNTS